MRCIPFEVQPGRWKLYRLHKPTPLSTYWGAYDKESAIKRHAREQHERNGVTEPEQIRQLNLWDAFYKRTRAYFEQAVKLYLRKVAFIAQNIISFMFIISLIPFRIVLLSFVVLCFRVSITKVLQRGFVYIYRIFVSRFKSCLWPNFTHICKTF